MPPEYPPSTTLLVHTGHRTPEKLHRGDCIVYVMRSKAGPLRMMSRAVGFPGETVHFTEGRLLVNGQPLREEYLSKALVGQVRAGKAEVRVGPGELYVLNDDRANPILDSRDFGALRPEQIVGKVITPVGGP